MRYTKSNVFILLSIAFASGVLAESLVPVGKLWLGIAMAFLILLFAIIFTGKSKRRAELLLVISIFFAASLGVLRMQESYQQNQFEGVFDTTQKMEGMIVSDIDLRRDKQLFEFQPKDFSQKILVTTTLYTSYSYGDQVVIKDKLEQAKNFDGFDYQKFLEKDNIYAVMRYPKIIPLKPNQGNWVLRNLLQLKTMFVSRIERVMPEPERSLSLGILIGAKKTLPDEVLEQFNASGLSHIVAVSGYNMSVIIVALAGLAAYVGRRASFWLSLGAIVSYVIITGASSSVMRAGIMGVLLLVSLNIGRLYKIIPALCFAALVMLLQNPKILFYDVGFQLSFLATLGIVLFVPLLEQLTERISNPLQLKSVLLATLSAIIATAPLIIFQFERFSLVAPLANILVLPVVPLAMLFGFVSAVPFIGTGFAFIARGLLWYILAVARYCSSLPLASIPLQISVWVFCLLSLAVVLLYIVLLLWKNRKFSARLPKASGFELD